MQKEKQRRVGELRICIISKHSVLDSKLEYFLEIVLIKSKMSMIKKYQNHTLKINHVTVRKSHITLTVTRHHDGN